MLRKVPLLILFICLIPAAAVADSSWERAVSVFGENDGYLPYRMEVLSETYNTEGKLEKTEWREFTLRYDSSGEIESRRLIKATENGKDVTEKRRKELESGGGGRPSGTGQDQKGMDKQPLDPGVQSDVSPSYRGRISWRNGIKCEVWDFEIKFNDKYRGVGQAWLDAGSGEAVSVEYYIDPQFPFVDEMNFRMDYTPDSGGRRLMNRFEMDAVVNMIIMKKNFRVTTNFSDYR